MNPLPEAAYLTLGKIEREMERHLLDAKLMPTTERPVVDVEALIERHLGARLDQFAALDADVLGVTHFLRGTRPKVEINADLTNAAEDDGSPTSVRGRWRITLAHEGAHIVLHRADMEAPEQMSLFGNTSSTDEARLHQCLKRDLALVTRVTRREYQANIGMAALLMPRQVFLALARPLLSGCSAEIASMNDPRLSPQVHELSEMLQVSRQAVRIRIESLGLLSMIGQKNLMI